MILTVSIIAYLGSLIVFMTSIMEQSTGFILFFATHLISCICYFRVPITYKLPNHLAWSPKVFAFVVLLPIFGLPIYIIASLRSRKEVLHSFVEEYEEHIRYTIGEDEFLPSEHLRQRHRFEKMNVSSWSNVIFAKGQVQEKIAALEALARQRTKASVRLIRHASKDDSSDVSYIAATAFIAMERPLLQQLDFWQKNVQQSPDNYHAYTHLGKTYYELCYLGLADAQNQTSFLIRALDAFKQARQIHGCPNNIYLDMGKTAMMLSNHHLASEYFQEYLTQSPSDIGGHLWNAELLYLQGRFGDLRVLMRSIKEKNLPESHRFRTLFEVWT